jgi:tRNA(fMet)-specific endonuclease VapC
MYMLDTDICIYLLKTHSSRLRQKFRVHRDLCISAITWAELCYGVENSLPEKRGARRQQLGEFARRLLVLPFEERSGPVYGRVRAQLRRDGALIGANDLLIAAHALAAGCTLVTNNVREFQRVEGLVVENWA